MSPGTKVLCKSTAAILQIQVIRLVDVITTKRIIIELIKLYVIHYLKDLTLICINCESPSLHVTSRVVRIHFPPIILSDNVAWNKSVM